MPHDDGALAQGLGERADLRLQDYRDIRDEPFDAIVSIEMFEAVGREYWAGYFATLSRCLKDGGQACIQTITIDDALFDRYVKSTDFIQQYIFPGGLLPCDRAFRDEARKAGLEVTNALAFGPDYAETLRRWRADFHAHLQQVRGLGFDERFRFYRHAGVCMENRGCLAEYDAGEDRYTLRATVQSAHGTRSAIADQLFRIPQSKLRVICDNMGGGFGMKGGASAEYALAMWAAEVLGRPVNWISERGEGILTDEQARDSVIEAELAVDKDARFLGLRTVHKCAIGAYNTSDRNVNPTMVAIGCLANTYTFEGVHAKVIGALKPPNNA